MKTVGMVGLVLSCFSMLFGFYLEFFSVPDSALEREQITNMIMLEDLAKGQICFDMPGYEETFAAAGKNVDYGGYLFFGSMLPFLLCLFAVFKKDKTAMLGPLAAFLIGTA